MHSRAAFAVFDSLTEKQHEALALAVQHMTSKQIALELGVAPVTIDKRIEAVRGRLGAISRPDLLRYYGEWCQTYGRAINDPIILPVIGQQGDSSGQQQASSLIAFEDSIPFDARASWDRGIRQLRPGLKPSDLDVTGKLLVMLFGAVAIMMVAVLCMAFADALMSILTR
jgi:DNA-binding CsgD family transcriptional regulator